MSTYQITATDEQDAALAWVAGEGDPATYLQARNTEILDSYVAQHNLASAPVPTKDVAYSYAYGTPEQQAQVVAVLGLEDATTRADVEAKAANFSV